MPGSPGSGVQPVDPCAPVPNNGGFIFGGIGSAIGMLGNLAGQSQRQQACAAQRQAQWNAYQARLSAAADQKQAALAAPAPATAPAPAPAPVAQTAPPPPAPPRPIRMATSHRASPGRVRVVEASSRAATIDLAAAEASPANLCREPAVARAIMAAWNGLERFKAHGITLVDIEHLTTSAADRSTQAYTCHGVYVTSEGDRTMGSLAIRRNVVGDPVAIWTRDADQELSHYRPPALPDAPSACDGGQQASRL
jgi:hypothetical protein